MSRHLRQHIMTYVVHLIVLSIHEKETESHCLTGLSTHYRQCCLAFCVFNFIVLFLILFFFFFFLCQRADESYKRFFFAEKCQHSQIFRVNLSIYIWLYSSYISVAKE